MRKYNEPLADENLERMHTAKNAKVRQEQIKEEAQAEARICAQKNKDRRRYVQCINFVASDEDFDPPILVNFSIDGIVLTFLIDSGADVNVISSKDFNTLKRAYTESKTTLTSFSNLNSQEIWKTSLLLRLKSFQDESTFIMAEPTKSHHQAILGRAWMQKHKCSIDWDKNTISVTYKGSRMSLPLVKQNNEPLVAPTSALLTSYT